VPAWAKVTGLKGQFLGLSFGPKVAVIGLNVQILCLDSSGLDHVCAMNPARMAKPTSMPFVREPRGSDGGRQAHAVYGRLSVSALLTSCDFLLVFIMLLSE